MPWTLEDSGVSPLDFGGVHALPSSSAVSTDDVIVVVHHGNSAPLSISDSVGLTWDVAEVFIDSPKNLKAWSAVVGSGANGTTPTITVTGGNHLCTTIFARFSGLDTTSGRVEFSVSAGGNSATPSSGATGVSAGTDYLGLAYVGVVGGVDVDASVGFTLVGEVEPDAFRFPAMMATQVVNASTFTATATMTVDGWVACALVFKTAGAMTPTGTVAVTLAAFTSTATGSHTTPSVDGSAAITLGAFVPTAAGHTTVSGTATPALAAFTSAASGMFGLAATFLETFDDSDAFTRFSINRFRVGYGLDEEAVEAVAGQDSTQGFGPDPPGDVRVTSGRLVVECGMQSYGETVVRSNTTWTGTGTIEFDVTGSTNGESQVVVLILEQPYAFTGFDGENAHGPKPANGIGIYARQPQARTWQDHVQTMWFQGGTEGPPSGVYQPGTSQHWALTCNSTHVWLRINGVDVNVGADIGGGVRRIPIPSGMSLVDSWISIGTHNHSVAKYTADLTCTNLFDNLTYEAQTEARWAEVTPNADARFGWGLTEDGVGTPIVHDTTPLALGTATAGWLVLNVGAYGSTDIDTDSRLHYSLNGNTTHEVAFQIAEHTLHFAKSLSIPVDLGELVNGVNEIEITHSDIGNPTLPRYANVQLVVVGGQAAPEGLYLGDTTVAAVKLGTTTVNKLMLGPTQVWP